MSEHQTDQEIIQDAREGKDLTQREILRLLNLSEPEAKAHLYPAADAVRREWVGDEIHLRGIIEFSNVCERDCLYCGLRRSNTHLNRYRMPEGEILTVARRIREEGICTVVLQSGEDSFSSRDQICTLVGRTREETGLTVTLSIGEKSLEDFRAYREAGAGRYLLKHETSSAELYRLMRPDSASGGRIRCLKDLGELGYEVGTGNIIGLPGQTPDVLADDLLLMKALDADMLGIGPFIPHPDTPLAFSPPGQMAMTLKVLAVARLLTRTTNIPATTALGSLDADGRIRALSAGANVVMPDFTPPAYRRLYEIYPGRNIEMDLSDFLKQLYGDIRIIGRKAGRGSGNRNK
jgi:biotin synthase